MTTMPLRAVDHTAPRPTGVSVEILTVSALLTMPAVWTAVVERALPAQVLLERFLVVLLTCALLAELVRRLGEGGALSHALAHAAPAPARGLETPDSDAALSSGRASAPALFDDELDSGAGFDAGFDDLGGPDQTSPLALDASFDVAPLDGGFDGGFDTDLAPLDLDADPF